MLLLDFDGTLSPLVDRPELAELPSATRAPLESLIRRPGVEAAVISGRSLQDVRQRVGLAGLGYAGNHGLEMEGLGPAAAVPDAESARPRVRTAAAELRLALSGVEEALVEDKGLTVSVHTRIVPRDRVPGVRRVVRWVAGKHGLVFTTGKEVLELRPAVPWHKGSAVEALLRQRDLPSGTPVLYVGDDRTDEDAFRTLAGAGLGEGVVVADPPPARTAARAWLRDPGEVRWLLQRLAEDSPC